jgi:Helix-turn-helix domain
MHLRPPREKVFGLARGFPHDRNARVRIEAFVLAWNAKNKQEGPPGTRASPPPISGSCTRSCGISRAYKDGLCFPSYETIAEKARCCRDTVYEAILALENTGVFSWVNRIDRVAERAKDLFGQWMTSYRIVRRSNVYEFRDPCPAPRP